MALHQLIRDIKDHLDISIGSIEAYYIWNHTKHLVKYLAGKQLLKLDKEKRVNKN